MRICITAAGTDWDAATQPNFGRAAFFLFVDPEAETLESVRNEPGAHGAGVQAAQTVADHGASAVITGSVGPNAFHGLTVAGIEVFIGATGTVREAFEAYRSGKLKRAEGATSRPHGGGRR
jgi:predicted Fe-Mo cluster-binding NifX family protein